MSLLARTLPAVALLALPATAAAESTEVLWYNGNNGHTSTDYATFQSAIEGEGGTFTATSTFPSSLTSYRMVVLVSPARLFNASQVTLLQEYLDAGGLLVMLGNSGGEAGSLGVLMNLSDDLGLSSTWVADELDTGCDTDGLGYGGTPATASPLNVCIDYLTYAGSSDMSAGTGADILFTGESDQPLVILEGTSLLVADRDIFFDTCTLDADNTTFFKKLYAGLDATSATDDDCDGFGPSSEGGEDCDDADATVNPDAEDICDGIDNDCNGDADDDPAYGSTWYLDSDNDGYGVTTSTTFACEDPEGYADNTSDCDDDDPDVHPGADETCNDQDDNCNGTRDDDPVDGTTWYADLDEDGYGSTSDTLSACDDPGTPYIATGGDCDDTLSRVHPDADEYCNDVDDDCDGTADDEPLNAETYYTDADGDGYGDPNSVVEACDAPDGAVVDGRDCDDTDPAIYPGAPGWTVTCEQLDSGSGDTGGETKDGGCSCSAAQRGASWWMLAPLGLLLGLRRRREG